MPPKKKPLAANMPSIDMDATQTMRSSDAAPVAAIEKKRDYDLSPTHSYKAGSIKMSEEFAIKLKICAAHHNIPQNRYIIETLNMRMERDLKEVHANLQSE